MFHHIIKENLNENYKTISDLIKIHKKYSYKGKLFMITDDNVSVMIEMSDLEDSDPKDTDVLVYDTENMNSFGVDISSLTPISESEIIESADVKDLKKLIKNPKPGYYYEHENGEIIFKPFIVVDMGGGPREYFDSSFVKRWWKLEK